LYKNAKETCGEDRTGHHLIPNHCFFKFGGDSRISNLVTGCEKYRNDQAVTICVEGISWHEKEHRKMHNRIDAAEASYVLERRGGIGQDRHWTYSEAKEAAIKSAHPCGARCIEAQLKDYYERHCGLKPDTRLRSTVTRNAMAEKGEKIRAERSKGLTRIARARK
jgi:hypothetical protein